jgi:hypothetical protein
MHWERANLRNQPRELILQKGFFIVNLQSSSSLNTKFSFSSDIPRGAHLLERVLSDMAAICLHWPIDLFLHQLGNGQIVNGRSGRSLLHCVELFEMDDEITELKSLQVRYFIANAHSPENCQSMP